MTVKSVRVTTKLKGPVPCDKENCFVIFLKAAYIVLNTTTLSIHVVAIFHCSSVNLPSSRPISPVPPGTAVFQCVLIRSRRAMVHFIVQIVNKLTTQREDFLSL